MESVGGGGGAWPEPVVMEFPTNSPAESQAKLPRRIRRRLLEAKSASSPSSAEAIEAKLREADLRRQRFYEWLSCKARPKPRSPSWSSQEEDLGQRIQARLFAAEQKRLSLLEKAQKRLARLDELRQAAKNGVELRMEKEREELGTRVESRARQAEENRLRLLAAYSQRRAALRERTAHSLVQRLLRENRYKERVRSAISQKRSAAEKKRLSLLEAEKRRAHARVMRARRIAKAVCSQRESERLRMEQQLKDKLQRAKAQRAEYLRQKGSPCSSSSPSTWEKDGDNLSRKLARCWRRFVRSKHTTYYLTKSYESLGVNSKSVKSMPFEQLAMLIESTATLEATKLLLERLESRFIISLATATSSVPAPQNIDHLLKHLGSPRKQSRSRGVTPKKGSAGKPTKKSSSRYAVWVVLCAYMILGHPNAVFSGKGEREFSLMEAASGFVHEFEILLKDILNGPDKGKLFREQLAAFDSAWCNYLYRFVAWKVKDARALEEDLVRAACKLELSMMQTCKVTADGETPELTHDMKAVQKQVTEDQKLLREKVRHLSGAAGLERMESALSDTRSKFFESKEKNTSSPMAHSASPSDSEPSSSVQNSIGSPDASLEKKKSHVARSLFGSSKEAAAAGEGVAANSGVLVAENEKLPTENEIFVNEILHETDGSIAASLTSNNGDEVEIKTKLREAMEKAFWDNVMDSLKGDKLNYSQVLDLVKEVRDELSDLAPRSLRQEILDSIDLDILSQVLDSGTDDRQYLGQILDFSLGMLRQLGSSASEDVAKEAHQKLLKELAETSQSAHQTKTSFVFAIVKGLRFTLEEIQKLKREVSKARIQMLEPLVQGTAGIEYLQKAFTERYGSPSDASVSLPLTSQWISSFCGNLEEEWGEYVNSLSALSVENNAQPLVMTLRTGGVVSANQILPRTSASSGGNSELPECTGDIMDKLVRLGLLKLVCGIEGVTLQSVPETLKLNALRLRSIQSEYQKIIVIATSMLVLRQILISEKAPNSYTETAITESVQKLSTLLDSSADVGLEEIVDILVVTSSSEALETKKDIMSRVLLKSLQNGDIIFNKVSAAVYIALRAIALAGSGVKGRKLAEVALRKVGGVILLDRVVKAGEVLVKTAVVSCQVHGLWYRCLV
ncbi:T-complex protein 11 [Rhynchospora pubera]|uniref:T-complex protein 11 n=1 Tax=Rhynchospora pubera TaxID=906938 RepID=A0AAV8CLC2_9POAL|nr:T-complex protein 11 [Rhynchospora pubera]